MILFLSALFFGCDSQPTTEPPETKTAGEQVTLQPGDCHIKAEMMETISGTLKIGEYGNHQIVIFTTESSPPFFDEDTGDCLVSQRADGQTPDMKTMWSVAYRPYDTEGLPWSALITDINAELICIFDGVGTNLEPLNDSQDARCEDMVPVVTIND